MINSANILNSAAAILFEYNDAGATSLGLTSKSQLFCLFKEYSSIGALKIFPSYNCSTKIVTGYIKVE